MKIFVVSSLLCFCTATFALGQDTWKSDPAHSRLGFAIDHLGINEVTGVFRKFDAVVTSSKPDFSDAVFQLTVDVASIDTMVEQRNEHLRSPDFFEAAKYATMTFKTGSLKQVGDGRYQLTGGLALHGSTKTVTMQLWYRGTTTNQKKLTAGFQLTGTLKRSDFGVGPKFPPPMIGDEVRIKADGEFIKQ